MPILSQMFMVFDVKSIGPHGDAFAVGWCVVDRTGEEYGSGYYACPAHLARGTRNDHLWVEDNLPFPSIPLTHTELRGMRDDFWETWRLWSGRGAALVADCAWPVETRFLAACIDDGPAERKWQGPNPLHDLASIRLAKGLDPLATEDRRANERPVHHPLSDARYSARLLIGALGS